MVAKRVAPFVGDSFNCPHCSALAHQCWFKGCISDYEDGQYPSRVPEDFRANLRKLDDDDLRLRYERFFSRKQTGAVFADGFSSYNLKQLINFDVSQCFSCKEFSFWIDRNLIHPVNDHEIQSNVDMPEDVKRDFEEAAKICRLSPRGSAALLRLCIQKLCVHLGGDGKNINADVASLVEKGLNVRVQKALDVVRVIGNNAVHPGELDISDDFSMARQLFGLVNAIVEAMITQPNTIDLLFEGLPTTSLKAIAKRDGT